MERDVRDKFSSISLPDSRNEDLKFRPTKSSDDGYDLPDGEISFFQSNYTPTSVMNLDNHFSLNLRKLSSNKESRSESFSCLGYGHSNQIEINDNLDEDVFTFDNDSHYKRQKSTNFKNSTSSDKNEIDLITFTDDNCDLPDLNSNSNTNSNSDFNLDSNPNSNSNSISNSTSNLSTINYQTDVSLNLSTSLSPNNLSNNNSKDLSSSLPSNLRPKTDDLLKSFDLNGEILIYFCEFFELIFKILLNLEI